MTLRRLSSTTALALIAVSLLAGGVSGQGQPAGKPAAAAPRTAWGAPSIEGVWDFTTNTALERPDQYKGREFLTAEEIAAVNTAANIDREPNPGDTGTYNAFWFQRGLSTGRTSLILDPPDGRIPPFTAEGQKRNAALRALNGFDSYENRGLSERCLTRPTLGPPIIPGNYNNYVRFVQTPTHVVIMVEMPTVARVVPLDGRPHLDPNIREWLGDSRGRWEGNTLVIETTNFTGNTNFRGSGRNMRLTERLTRVDADTLGYEFTVNDPETYTRPWTAAFPMKKTTEGIYEYACHEGNDTVVNILSGARAEEKTKGAAAGTPER